MGKPIQLVRQQKQPTRTDSTKHYTFHFIIARKKDKLIKPLRSSNSLVSTLKLAVNRPVSLGLILFLAFFPLVAFEAQPARALPVNTSVLLPCPPDLCKPNVWAPYGPFVPKLQFQFYSGDNSEFNAFLTGKIDVTDIPVPASIIPSIIPDPDFSLSSRQGGFQIRGIYFNGASSRFSNSREFDTGANGPFWGCDWNAGTPFTNTEQTYVSPCGINMRQAFAHLIDRPSFASLFGLAPIADPSPPAKDPSGSNITAQCSWDQMFPNCISAYRIAPDPSGFAIPGSPDFCAAADHMIAAGVATGKQQASCILAGVNPEVFAHPLRLIQRRGDPIRQALMNGFALALNRLFGGQVANICVGQFCGNPFATVFTDPPIGPIDDWDSYSYGYILSGPFPDHLSSLYNSQFATNYCGGQQNGEPSNPSFVCIPQLDLYIKAAGQTNDVNVFRSDTLAAFNVLGSHAVEIPSYSFATQTVALSSVAGLVDQKGIGYPNTWTMLNGHQGTYTPLNPLYTFGGGDPTTMRYGQASPPFELNVFNAQSDIEFRVLSEIYDTLLINSPVEPGKFLCWMCNTYSETVDSAGNTHFLVELRQTLKWHDGAALDAYDVKFSLLNLRDFSYFGGLLSGVLRSVQVLSPSTLDIVFTGQSISFPYFLTTFIIPRHLWEMAGDKTYGDVGRVDLAKLDYTYDPVTDGTLIGSGPFICSSVFPEDLGRVGTGCARNADGSRGGQALDPGASLLLQAFDLTGQPSNTDPFLQYQRSFNASWGTGTGTAAESGQFQEFSWADRYDNATVTIQDMASVASCYGASGPTASCSSSSYNYWLKSAFHPSSPSVITTEVTIVASHLDDTWVSPFSWSGNQSSQPGQTLQDMIPFTP